MVLMVASNRMPREKYLDLKKNCDKMSEKLKVWLGAKETASGYKSIHNLSITVFPDYNKKSPEQRNTQQELGPAKGLSDQD